MSDKLILDVTTGATYSGSTIALCFGAFSVNEIAAFGGLILGTLTFTVNVFFNIKRLKILANKQDK